MVRHPRGAVARLLMAVSSAVLLIPTVAAGGGSIAFAGTCSAGDIDYTVTTSNKDVLFTHSVLYATLAPGGYASRTLTKSTSFTAGITFTFGATAEAGVIFAKASASAGVALKAEGTTTSGSSVTIGITNNTSAYHDYVFFDGTRTAKGTWKRYKCVAGSEQLSSTGTWKSWNAQYAAVLRCDDDAIIASTYGTWSVQYRAVQTC
ncbi:MAG: hypothetical protein L0227_01465 [Chloroflexi bacterium]|nr:hypothetical protein [Chloroflexota bacterium]